MISVTVPSAAPVPERFAIAIHCPPAPPRLVATTGSPTAKMENALSAGAAPGSGMLSIGVNEQTGVPPAGYEQPYCAGFAIVRVLFARLSADTVPLTVTSWITAAAGSTQRHRTRRVMGRVWFTGTPSVVSTRDRQESINKAQGITL
jgi:hypothetical protein